MKNYIRVKGANEHNLKNISVDIPKNSLVVITGLSGSGKSSLAFDTIYAEGQRRFLEGLSSFSRQYMVQFKKPEVESIQGLTPAIAIEQKTTNTSPRSTVGTITGIYDFLRLLYARVGTPKCPDHNLDVKSSDTETVLGQLLNSHMGQKIQILAPVASQKKGEFQKELRYWESKGFVKAHIDGQWVQLSDVVKLAKTKPHDIDILVDQLPVEEKFSHRIKSSLNRAFDIASGLVSIVYLDKNEKALFSLDSSCPKCGYSFPELDPNHFSFNNPRGACEDCKGLGTMDIQEESVMVDGQDGQKSMVSRFKYNTKSKDKNSDEAHTDEDDEIPTHLKACETCNGTRLNLKARSVFISDKNIADLSLYSLSKLKTFFSEFKLSGRDHEVGDKIIKQILSRLTYIENIGAGYLSLSRSSATLSGGESQRIRLATQLGASMVCFR
jgi:excinuclease ABC subunit A